MLSGYKTYIVAAIMGVAWALLQLDIITLEAFKQLEALLISLGLATLRAGVKKAEKKAERRY